MNYNARANSSAEATTASPEDRRKTSSAFSPARMRHSFASSETPESSTAASLRGSFLHDDPRNSINEGGLGVDLSREHGKGSFRSHRSRHSGGFLLSSTAFEPPNREVTPPRSTTPLHADDAKGKSPQKSSERRHKKRSSNVGMVRSPLAGNVTTAAGAKEQDAIDHPEEKTNERTPGKGSLGTLDVDSTQIVNLALNLSESRRNASRRLVSNPLPPVGGFAENMAGGSMRYHMQQQQRRASRNISPKPDRGERNMSLSGRIPSSGRMNSPLQPAFDMQNEGQYQYHFSASTLARAQKAKQTIELMARYRELLQHLPPLKPQGLERITTASTMGSVVGSPISPYPYIRTYSSKDRQRPLGRPFNPLQYIRNRKVRARLSKSIDGDAEGFGDVELVTRWVQQVSEIAKSPDLQTADYLTLPSVKATDPSQEPQASPTSTLGRANTIARLKRPRIDWVTSPADMIADVFWLEQNDHKKLIEDRFGRRIFPQQIELRRPVSDQERISNAQHPSDPPVTPPKKDSQLDGSAQADKLPQFKSIKHESENFAEKGASRARETLRHVRDAARMHHHNGSGRDGRQFLRSRSRSDASTSDSDSDEHPRRRRSGTADSHDNKGKEILAKQMASMLEEETKASDERAGIDHQGRRSAIAIEQSHSLRNNDRTESFKVSAGHSRSASLANHSKRNSLMNNSSGRASLEVPGSNPRASLDLDLDTTAPNSPELRASRLSNQHVPSISMDLTSSRSRQSSPRRALSKVRAKIRSHHDRSYNSDQSLLDDDSDSHSHIMSNDPSQEIADPRRRSMSPTKRLLARTTGDGLRQNNKADLGRKEKTEDPSGIRGFLKSARNPVNRVSGMIWKKDSSPGHGFSSGVSTDGSDVDEQEELPGTISGIGKFNDLAEAHPPREQPSYLKEMPSFVPASESRGRSSRSREQERGSSSLFHIQEDRARRRSSSKPYPVIQVQSPASSPEFIIPRWGRRSSSPSDSRRGSLANVQQADSRLNAMLNYSKPRRDQSLPVTGLTGIDASNRRPSMQGKRQWSISDQAVNVTYGPTTKREIARVRALLLSSGIKAKEISRRAADLTELGQEKVLYSDLVALSQKQLSPISKSQRHILAGQILSDDIQLSTRLWQESADVFSNNTVGELLSSIEALQSRVTTNLTPKTRKAADEADEVSKDLVTSQTLNVKRIGDKIEKMIRTRRRRFRWLRRGGWVMVEWLLVGVMWYVWFLVVLGRIVIGVGRGILKSLRWLFFLD